MRKRNIRHVVRLDEEENKKFLRKVEICVVCKESCLRSLIEGYAPQPRLPDEFLRMIAQLRAIGNNLNQIAMVANSTGVIDKESYREEAKYLREAILEIRSIVCTHEKISRYCDGGKSK